MLLWTLSRKWLPQLAPRPSRSHTSCLMVKSSQSEMRDSDAQRLCFNHLSWVWKLLVSTKPPTTRSWSVILISVRICTPTLSCQEVPPCTQALLIVCKRKSPLWLHRPWRSKSLLRQRESTRSGSAAPSWPPCPLSSPCGSRSKSTMNLVHPSSTENAFRFSRQILKKLERRNSQRNIFILYFFFNFQCL